MWEYNYPDELYHYGVKGMKWGVRRASDTSGGSRKARFGSEEYYRNKAARAVAKVNSRKTRLGKDMANLSAFRNEATANRKAALKSDKGIRKTIDNVYGHGANAANQKAAANYYDRKAGYVKTRLSKTQAEANAFNSRTAAEANKKLHNSKIRDYGKNYIEALTDRKIKTWSGRTTTTGKQYVDNLLTGGVHGLVEDVKYYRSHK